MISFIKSYHDGKKIIDTCKKNAKKAADYNSAAHFNR